MPPHNILIKRLSEFTILISFSLSLTPLTAGIKGLWLTAWDIDNPQKIDRAVKFALENDIGQLLVHARYRADALYRPNRIFDRYHNPEPVSYILQDEGFDPLLYIIEKTSDTDIEIHAWTTVFTATPRTLENICDTHVYHTHPQWMTRDVFGNVMEVDSHEGVYLDAGVPQVQDYLINVLKDIVINYDIDGLHLDYIRYPGSQFGYAEKALQSYYSALKKTDHLTEGMCINKWKQEQITRFVRRCNAEIKKINPQLILSAAVISNLDRARHNYSQRWTDWLDEGIIDYAYVMAYGLDDETVNRELFSFNRWRDRIVVGLRAWHEEERPYYSADVRSKISIVKQNRFAGLSLFSLGGLLDLIDDPLRKSLVFAAHPSKAMPANIVFGYITGENGEPLPNIMVTTEQGQKIFSDANGFYRFVNNTGSTSLKAEKGIRVFLSDTISLPKIFDVNVVRYNINFWQR